MRITDHIYLLSGAGYGQVGNVYAILSEKKLILIDTGEDAAALEIITDMLSFHGLSKYPVTDVLITHMHQDHSGNAWYFRKNGAKIWSSDLDASGIETGGIRVNEFGFNTRFTTCTVDERLSDGQKFSINGIEFQALLMPGHTNGSMFFLFELDGKSFVCTGDTVLPDYRNFDGIIEASFGWNGSYEMDKEKYLASMHKALSIQADILLGGHCMPVMRNGDHVLKRAFRTSIATFR